MKKVMQSILMLMMTLVLFSGYVSADSGIVRTKLKNGVIETGTKIIKRGDLCEESVTELVGSKPIKSMGVEIQAPEVKTITKITKCKDAESKIAVLHNL